MRRLTKSELDFWQSGCIYYVIVLTFGKLFHIEGKYNEAVDFRVQTSFTLHICHAGRERRNQTHCRFVQNNLPPLSQRVTLPFEPLSTINGALNI